MKLSIAILILASLIFGVHSILSAAWAWTEFFSDHSHADFTRGTAVVLITDIAMVVYLVTH